MNYFEEPNISPLKEEFHVEESIVLEEYVEVKEENIEIFEEINEGLVIKEEPDIKIVEGINKDPIIEKDLEVKILEIVRLNLFNHLLALFRAKFACNLAIRYPVFRWELCRGSV